MKKKINGKNYNGVLGSTLSFFDLFKREQPHYRLFATTNEKEKGMMMIESIKNYFGITDEERQKLKEELDKKEVKDFGQKLSPKVDEKNVKFTRDEKGRIISPFSKWKNRK